MSRLYTGSFAVAVVSQTGFVLANLLMAHYARWIAYLGGDVADVGWIMGIGSLAALLLRPWTGQWLNRLGARNMWAIGYGFFLIGSLGNLLIYDLNWAIYVLRSSLILGVACVSSSSLTYISQISSADRQAEAIGILGVGGFIGFFIGPYLGDLILGSGQRYRSDFAILFLTAGGIVVLASLVLCFLPRPADDHRSSSVRLKDFVHVVTHHWPGMILIVVFAFGVCMTVPLAFLAKYIDEERISIPGWSAIGIYFVIYAALGLTMRIGFRRVPDRFGRRKVLLIGMAMMSAGMFSFLLVSPAHPWCLVIPAVLCGIGHGLIFHTATALVLATFPNNVRGTGSALSFIMLDLGLMVGAPALGLIADTHGYGWMFFAIGALCLGVAILYGCSVLAGYRMKDEATAVEAEPQTLTSDT